MRPTLKVTSYQNTTKKRDNTNVQPEDFQKIAEEKSSQMTKEFQQSVPGYDTKIMIHKKEKKKVRSWTSSA